MDVGTGKPGCNVTNAGAKGTRVPAAESAVSADGHLHGANGLILLREPASLPLPRHCDVYSRALHCSDIHVYGILKGL